MTQWQLNKIWPVKEIRIVRGNTQQRNIIKIVIDNIDIYCEGQAGKPINLKISEMGKIDE